MAGGSEERTGRWIVLIVTEGDMTCRKCGGLMYKEVIYTQQGSLLVFRCIHCGEIIDPLIVTNRR